MGEAVTLFPPDCRDEILQTDVPIAPNPSDEPLILTEGSLISSPCGKHLRCPKIHLSVTKWTHIFPFEEKLLTDLLLTVGVKHVENSQSYYKRYSPLQLLFPLGMNFHFTLFFITRIGRVSDKNIYCKTYYHILYFSSAECRTVFLLCFQSHCIISWKHSHIICVTYLFWFCTKIKH